VEKRAQKLVPCECGCGGTVLTPDKYGTPRRFLRGHQNKNKRGWRWGKGKNAQYRGLTAPCGDGCGVMVELTGDRRRRYAQGLPVYVNAGHACRGKPSPNPLAGKGRKNSKETRRCECGDCEEVIRRYDKSGREHHYAKGHFMKGKPGAMKGKHQPLSQQQALCDVRAENPTWKLNLPGKKIPYKDIKFRSPVEVMLAKGLDFLGLHWTYEPCPLRYIDAKGLRRSTTPDFFVEEWDKFVEVTKTMYTAKRKKMDQVTRSNPDITIETWTQNNIRDWLLRIGGPLFS
jgi:hypothetical protein